MVDSPQNAIRNDFLRLMQQQKVGRVSADIQEGDSHAGDVEAFSLMVAASSPRVGQHGPDQRGDQTEHQSALLSQAAHGGFERHHGKANSSPAGESLGGSPVGSQPSFGSLGDLTLLTGYDMCLRVLGGEDASGPTRREGVVGSARQRGARARGEPGVSAQSGPMSGRLQTGRVLKNEARSRSSGDEGHTSRTPEVISSRSDLAAPSSHRHFTVFPVSQDGPDTRVVSALSSADPATESSRAPQSDEVAGQRHYADDDLNESVEHIYYMRQSLDEGNRGFLRARLGSDLLPDVDLIVSRGRAVGAASRGSLSIEFKTDNQKSLFWLRKRKEELVGRLRSRLNEPGMVVSIAGRSDS